MINHQNQPTVHLSWQAMLWRLLVTILLLIVLAGSSLTIFNNVTSHPDTEVLPPLTYETDIEN